MHFFKKSRSSAGSDILAFGSHCLAKFQLILNWFIQTFKLKYEGSENTKTDCVNTVVFGDTWYGYKYLYICMIRKGSENVSICQWLKTVFKMRPTV